MEGKYRVLIENGSRKLELESDDEKWIDKQKAEIAKALHLYEMDVKPPNVKSKAPHSRVSSSGRTSTEKLTINEFYKKYCAGLKTNPDKAVYFIYYLSWVENKKSVSTNDVRDLFIKGGIPKANKLNIADVLSKAKKRALLNYIDNNWSLTITGEDFVVNSMQANKSE